MSAVRKIIEDHRDDDPSLEQIAQEAFELIFDITEGDSSKKNWWLYQRRISSGFNDGVKRNNEISSRLQKLSTVTTNYVDGNDMPISEITKAVDNALVTFARLLSDVDMKDNIELDEKIRKGEPVPEGHKPLPEALLAAHDAFQKTYANYVEQTGTHAKSEMKPKLNADAKELLRQAAIADATGEAKLGSYVAVMGKMIEFGDAVERQQGQAKSA